MANAVLPSAIPAATLPRLQALKQSNGDLDDQIRQATQIIGLPDEKAVLARADYVLRFVLERLGDATEYGTQARANSSAWSLLGGLVHILPVSRCAQTLRDSNFVTILEQTLQETVQEDPQPTRKRKRGTSSTSKPSKRTAVEAAGPVPLFSAVSAVIQSLRAKGQSHGDEGFAQAEHMKMVLKTESAQAARILKCWFGAVERLASAGFTSACPFLDLSPVIELWELRTIDSKDSSGASSEEFATECLLPALMLSQTLQRAVKGSSTESDLSAMLSQAVVAIDRLVARHVLGPARSGFLSGTSKPTDDLNSNDLSTSLAPLRAKLLQAAQIEDIGEVIPPSFLALFAAIPQLLDLTVRSSPARSRKSRAAERPWIQAAFVALAGCAGFALEAPQFNTPKNAIDALRECLRVLASHDVGIDSDILKDLFLFYSGFKFPSHQEKTVHWSLVASLIELDTNIFLTDPRSTWNNSEDKPDDLANYLFDQISAATFEPSITHGDKMEIDEKEGAESHASTTIEFTIDDVVQTILVPLISAFARNRDLLGFVSRWDGQMIKVTNFTPHALERSTPSIWEHRQLSKTLATHFEQSLTPTQISNVFQEHAKRLKSNIESKKGSSSSIIVQAMLRSVTTDEVIQPLKPYLLSLWNSYTIWIQDNHLSSTASPGVAWLALSPLLVLLWPIQFHSSPSFQKEHLFPLVEQASKDVGTVHKNEAGRRVDSNSRATAMAFLFTACECLRSLPDTRELIQKRLRKAHKPLSSNQLELEELTEVTEFFCTGYVQFLEAFERDTCQTLLSALLATISKLEEDDAKHSTDALSQSVFRDGSASLQEPYLAALLEAIAHHDEELRTVAITSLLHCTPSSIPREQREAALDIVTETLISQPRNVGTLLSLMVHLMEVANATAMVSSDGAVLFKVAQSLHDAKLETASSLQQLQRLTLLTLTHIIPNKGQSQNKNFLEVYQAQVASTTKKAHESFPARLALLRGTFLVAHKGETLLPTDPYVEFLNACLQDVSDSEEYILEAFNDIPHPALSKYGSAFSAAQAALRKWTTSKLLNSHLRSLDVATYNSLPEKLWPAVHGAIARYRLCADDQAFLQFSSDLLRQDLSTEQKAIILLSVKKALLLLDTSGKLALLPLCTPTSDEDSAVPSRVLHVLVSTLEDKQEADPALKEQQLALLPKICLLLEDSAGDAAFNALLDSVITILHDKPSLTTQHGVECVIVALAKLTSRNSPRLSADNAPAIFVRLCEATRSVLLLHRGRIGGRFHLLLPLLQGLFLCLFIPNAGRGAALPPWLDSFGTSNPVRLTPSNAASYTRLLSTLCSPTQSSVQRHNHSKSTSKNELNDPVKAARDYASQYVYVLLSSFCRFQLYGRLEPMVRDQLMPGLWEVISVGSLDRVSLDAMFEGLGRSEKDVWRGIWRDWEKENGRQERVETAR